jgi:hypothetical protein
VECFWSTPKAFEEGEMGDSALLIIWGPPQAGRESHAVELFQESLLFFTRLVEERRIAAVEPFFLEPHGGTIEGFFLVRGEMRELATLRTEDDFRKMTVKAQVIVQNFAVIGAITGKRLNKHMGWFVDAALALGKGRGRSG